MLLRWRCCCCSYSGPGRCRPLFVRDRDYLIVLHTHTHTYGMLTIEQDRSESLLPKSFLGYALQPTERKSIFLCSSIAEAPISGGLSGAEQQTCQAPEQTWWSCSGTAHSPRGCTR